MASGMGEEAMYFSAQWNDMSIIKHINLINQYDNIRKYTDVNFADLRSQYPEYDFAVEVAENAQKWLEANQKIDDFYISNVNKFIDSVLTPYQVLYKVTGEEIFNCLDSTYRNTVKGCFAAAYHTTDIVTKLPATILMLPKSYIESDYLYRCEFEEKFGFRPFKYSAVSRCLFSINTVSSMGICILDDFENKVFLGTAAEREQFLGGVLFELCVTLASINAAQLLDDASLHVDAKNPDDFLAIIKKSDSELNPEQLEFKKQYQNSENIDDIANKINELAVYDNKTNITYDNTGNNYISYCHLDDIPENSSTIIKLFDEYHAIEGAPTRIQTGKYGESIASQMLKENGWEIIESIKNGSDNGIDIIARDSHGQIGFFEVKSSSLGKISNLSQRQQNVEQFVKGILFDAKEKKGRYKSIDSSTQQRAAVIWDELHNANNNGRVISATAIGIDFKNNQIHISKW